MFAKRFLTLLVGSFLLATLAQPIVAQAHDLRNGYAQKRDDYTIYYPIWARDPAPVVVFLHGFSNDRETLFPVVAQMDAVAGMGPLIVPNAMEFVTGDVGQLDEYHYMFESWLSRGWIVIAPRWQVGYEFFTPWTWQENVKGIVGRALAECSGHDKNRIAIGGHSMGAVLALRLAADVPMFRAVFLYDIMGLEFTPLLACLTSSPPSFTQNTGAYDDFSGIQPPTELLLLTAHETFNKAYFSLFTDSSGGLIARAWHGTPDSINKHHLIVVHNYDRGILSRHRGPMEPGIREVYRQHTNDFLDVALETQDQPYTPDLSARYNNGHPKAVSLPLWYEWCEPVPFEWSEDKLELPGVTMLGAGIFLDCVRQDCRSMDWWYARITTQYCLIELRFSLGLVITQEMIERAMARFSAE